jgi:hypothetical protein
VVNYSLHLCSLYLNAHSHFSRFVAQINTSDGTVRWLRQIGSSGKEVSERILLLDSFLGSPGILLIAVSFPCLP